MWKAHLEKKGFRTLLFNAWECDFTDDALISMLGDFRIAAQGWDPTSTSDTRRLEKIVATLAKHALPLAANAVVRALTLNAIDTAKFADELGKAVEGFAAKQIEEYQNQKKSIAHFKKELETFADLSSERYFG